MIRLRYVVALLWIASGPAWTFESDVHYGLTQWLATQAGFDQNAARIIATGDQRVDSGDMPFIDVVLIDACGTRDDLGVRLTSEHHYPSAGAIPGAPEQRTVAAGSDAASKAAVALTGTPPDKASFMLLKLGEALHALQDSWSHQGSPEIPQPGEGLGCDRTRAWGHPKARGGWNSHRADLTWAWPADTVMMAKATYDILVKFPMPAGRKQPARRWEDLRPLLDRFISASTKTDKKNWFVAQGVQDVSFLEGISLPDGREPFDATWNGRKLPPLSSVESRQHYVDADLLAFFNRFFTSWIGTDRFDDLVAEFGAVAAGRSGAKSVASPELGARLKLWRLRDHGQFAEIAHSAKPLTAAQRAAIDKAAKTRTALARYSNPGDAFFPLLPREKDVSPLLPFYIAQPPSAGSNPRAIAITKLRHAPYDSVAIAAERIDGRWRVVAVTANVEH